MANTKVLEEYKLSYRQWTDFIRSVEKVFDGSTKDQNIISNLNKLVEIVFPDLPPGDYQQVLGRAYPKMLEAFAREVPNQTEKVKEILQQLKAQDIVNDTTGAREKIKSQLEKLAERTRAEKLPEAVVVTTGKIINIEKPSEEAVQEVSTDRHYNPVTGKIEGMVPQSDQKKQELKSEVAREERNKEKYERYGKEPANWREDPGGNIIKTAKSFANQIFRQEKIEREAIVAPPKTIFDKVTSFVGIAKKPEEKVETRGQEQPRPQTRSAAEIAKISQRVGDTREIGAVATAAIAAKNFFSNFLERKESKPQHVEFAQNTAKFSKKPSSGEISRKPSQIYNPRGSGVVKNTVSPKSKAGLMAGVSVTAKRLASFDSFMSIFDVLSRGGTSVIQFFQGAMVSSNKIFLVIFLVVIFVPMGALIFMQTMKQTAFVQFTKTGAAGDTKSSNPPAPFTVTKTASYNSQTKIINYDIQGPTGGDDSLSILPDNIQIKNPGKVFDASKYADKTIINTYTIQNISATAVTVIGNGPLEAAACPVASVDRIISLGSENGANGHCGTNYPAPEFCSGTNAWRGNDKAIDVFAQKNMVGEPVVIPAINIGGKLQSLNWTKVTVNVGGDTQFGQDFIQYKASFVDTDGKTKEVLLEMHHLMNPTGTSTAKTGDVVAYFANFPGGEASPHVHIQTYIGDNITVNPTGVDVSGGSWVAADPYFANCKNFPK